MEVRSVRLNIPETVDEYIIAKNSGDPDECEAIKIRFNAIYEDSDPELKGSIDRYVHKFLTKNKLEPIKDLDGLFDMCYTSKK